MAIPSKSIEPVVTSWREPALPAFSALCDEAARRCSTQHGLPITLSDEVRLHAWQLCWLAMDAASAPANNLPDIADAQGWPPELVEQLHAVAKLPKLNTQTWQELRRARDEQLFETLLPQEPTAAETITDEALAEMLTECLAELDLTRMRARVTPPFMAVITRWLSACLLALDAQALGDDDTDASALALAVFVQQRLPGEVEAIADDATESEPEPVAAVSDSRNDESAAVLAKPQPVVHAAPMAAAAQPSMVELDAEPQPVVHAAPMAAAAQPSMVELAAEPQPVVPAAPMAAAAQPSMVELAAEPSAPEPAVTSEQPLAASWEPRPAARPQSFGPRAIAGVASVVAIAAVLLLMFTGSSAPRSDAKEPMNVLRPRPLAPEPARVATPKPAVVEPVVNSAAAEPAEAPARNIKQPTVAASQRPRFRNLAAAKRAHTAKKLDDAGYEAAIAELSALRSVKIAKEQRDLRSGKLSQAEYQRKVDAIDKNLGFDRH